jgi:hypothetical protein
VSAALRSLAIARLRARTEKAHASSSLLARRFGPASPLEAELCNHVEELADIVWKLLDVLEGRP